ncbi:hypothetical protein MHYP_G00099120 [Metynnis hypsauchen]
MQNEQPVQPARSAVGSENRGVGMCWWDWGAADDMYRYRKQSMSVVVLPVLKPPGQPGKSFLSTLSNYTLSDRHCQCIDY